MLMPKPSEFSFGNSSVARSYDTVLVPILFDPWAEQLVEDHAPWGGKIVLDLASGTGIVARKLADRVGASGKVIASDINGEMLEFARARCADIGTPVDFIQSPAHPLDLPDASVDVVVCQQGYQFFPDRPAATGEMKRVLRTGGRAIVSTWCSVGECQLFGMICGVLESMGERELSGMLRLPFDHMPGEELLNNFTSAGFRDVTVQKKERPMVIEGGIEAAVSMSYSTPIGPKLTALPDARQADFKQRFSDVLRDLQRDGRIEARMVSLELSATAA